MLAAMGAAAAVAFGQTAPAEPAAAPVALPPPVVQDLPAWVMTALSTGTLGLLLRTGGIPLRHTVELAERDRDLLRDLRDHITRNR